MKRLELCLADIRQWLTENHLKLNDQKTQFMILGQKSENKKIGDVKHVKIWDSVISATDCVQNIGVIPDSSFVMKSHVNYVTRSSYMPCCKIYSFYLIKQKVPTKFLTH